MPLETVKFASLPELKVAKIKHDLKRLSVANNGLNVNWNK